jgi:hypothetical protein
MLTPLLVVAALAAQADQELRAPAGPVFVDVGVLPNDGATDVPLDTLVWANDFNGTHTLVGPDGPLDVEVERLLEGPAFVQGVRPVAGFEPETRYTVLDAFGENVLGEFTTGTDETSTPPGAPVISSADQIVDELNRRLRYGVGAFDNLYVLVNPDSTTDPSFVQGIIDSGGPFETFAPEDGEVTTTFIAMNSAGQLSEVVTEVHEAPAGCRQATGEPVLLLVMLGLLTGLRAGRRSPCTRRPRPRSGSRPRT